MAVLVITSVFWAANDYARAQGLGEAREFASKLELWLPAAIVFSADRIHLSGPGVEETELEGALPGQERFRYDGFRLWLRSGGHYVLIPGEWTRDDGTVVLLPEDSVRIEFRPGGAVRTGNTAGDCTLAFGPGCWSGGPAEPGR